LKEGSLTNAEIKLMISFDRQNHWTIWFKNESRNTFGFFFQLSIESLL
jgi:hypothetical protein